MANFWSNVFQFRRRDKQLNEDKAVKFDHSFSPTAVEKNPLLPVFDQVGQDIDKILDTRSVVAQSLEDDYTPQPFWAADYAGITAMPLLTNKAQRIQQYRSMAAFLEIDWAIDELANDIVHEDEDGEVIHLNFNEARKDLTQKRKEILLQEFEKYMSFFHLKEDSYNIVKRFLIEGELAYENIINPEHEDMGIIGVRKLNTEYYETLIDTKNGNPVGIYFDTAKLKRDIKEIISMSCIGSQNIFNNMITTSMNVGMFGSDTSVPILWPQLTYISSGFTSPDGLMTFSIMEKVKQAYHQLALLQDSAVILRVTRAPERLLFNINTGKMTDKVAEQFVRDFVNQMKSKRVVQHGANGSPDVGSVYDPVSLLESYYFARGADSEGTTVESVGSSADYEQIGDIDYFTRRLFKAGFKIPFSRWKTPENTIERNDQITAEEYSLSRLELNIQRRFEIGFKNGFITHLKLRGLWKKYALKEKDIQIKMIPPVLYDLYEKQQMLQIKIDMYSSIADRDEFSKILAMKKIFGMTDEEIEDNFKNLMLEGQYAQLVEFFKDKISDDNPPLDFKSPLRLKGDPEDEASKEAKPEESEEENNEEGENGEEGKEEASSEEGEEETNGNDEAGEEENNGEENTEEAPEQLDNQEKETTSTGNTPDGFGLG